jgi:hypothetical protein
MKRLVTIRRTLKPPRHLPTHGSVLCAAMWLSLVGLLDCL